MQLKNKKTKYPNNEKNYAFPQWVKTCELFPLNDCQIIWCDLLVLQHQIQK